VSHELIGRAGGAGPIGTRRLSKDASGTNSQEGELVISNGPISKRLIFCVAALLAAFSLSSAHASTSAATEALKKRITAQLETKYPGARVELLGGVAFGAGTEAPASIQSVSFVTENGRGDAQVMINGANTEGEEVAVPAWVRFNALVPAHVALRRILPGERLDPEAFALREVDVAQGMLREFRGVLLPKDSDLAHLETRQTILEGQPALSSGVVRVPDVRKGEAVQIRVFSGALTLSTSGVAEEPAYLDSKIRVMTAKTKRELTGKLRSGGVVEVQL
jgi:flagella basal body P-ring formation protein FlgA